MIRTLYLEGVKVKTLSEKFKVSEFTIKSRCHRERWMHVPARIAEKAANPDPQAAIEIHHDIWAERKRKVRETEFVVADKILTHAATLTGNILLDKADKVKIGADIARRTVGLDKDGADTNAVNIAILGSYETVSVSRGGIEQPESIEVTSSEPILSNE